MEKNKYIHKYPITKTNNYNEKIIIMKTITITIALLFFGITSAYTQNTTSRIGVVKSESISAMQRLESIKSGFIGKRLSYFLEEYEKYLPIRFMGISTTSPWIHPEAKSYVSGIIICYKDDISVATEYSEEGNWLFLIEFQNPYMDYFTFWKQFPDSMTAQQKADFIGNHYSIKGISLYLSKKR